VEGLDIEPRFVWNEQPKREFRSGHRRIVVDVLPSLDDPMSAIQEGGRFVRSGGSLLIAARSDSANRYRGKRWELAGAP
jgi:hypothetical protein